MILHYILINLGTLGLESLSTLISFNNCVVNNPNALINALMLPPPCFSDTGDEFIC